MNKEDLNERMMGQENVDFQVYKLGERYGEFPVNVKDGALHLPSTELLRLPPEEVVETIRLAQKEGYTGVQIRF